MNVSKLIEEIERSLEEANQPNAQVLRKELANTFKELRKVVGNDDMTLQAIDLMRSALNGDRRAMKEMRWVQKEMGLIHDRYKNDLSDTAIASLNFAKKYQF